MKRLLLTGITGYVGGYLAKACLDAGYAVVGLKRVSSNTESLLQVLHRIELVDVDKSSFSFQDFFKREEQFDVIVHTATSYGRSGERLSEVLQANTVFPLMLLEAACEAGVPLFVNTGTALKSLASSYAISKSQFADWGRQFAGEKCIRFVELKLQHFFGPGEGASKFTGFLIRSCLKNLPELKLTAGDQLRDFVYIDDVLSAYLIILGAATDFDQSYCEIDVGSGEAFAVRRLAEKVKLLTASRTKLLFGAVPYRKGEEMFLKADTSRIESLGWHRKFSLDEGLKLTIEGTRL